MRPRLPGPVTVRVVLVLMALLVFGPAAAAQASSPERAPSSIPTIAAGSPI